MGAVCQYQSQGSETYFNQEIQTYLHISKELKPKSINNSIKHDLKAKYQDIDCDFYEKPQMREIASQTQISINNTTQFVTLKNNRQNHQKKKKNQKSKDRLISDNLKQCKQRSQSQPSQAQNQVLKYQNQKNQGKDKLQDFQPYVVLINSQKQSIFNYQPQNQIKDCLKQ